MIAVARLTLIAVLALSCAACREAPAPAPIPAPMSVAAASVAPAPAERAEPAEPAAPPLGPELAAFLDLAREPYTLEAWPGASRARCEPFRSDGYEHWHQDLYCVECSLEQGRGVARFRFYPDLAKGACTLQAIHVLFPASGMTPPAEVEAVVVSVLGPSVAVTKVDGVESGSAFWRSVRLWSTADQLAYLYYEPADPGYSHPIGRSGTVRFLWRRAPLRAIADARFDDGLDVEDRHAPALALALAACREAGLSDCDRAREAIATQDRAAFTAVFDATLDRFRGADLRDRRSAALVYWLDAMAREHYDLLGALEPDTQERLAGRGVVYEGWYDSLLLTSPWLADLAARDGKSKWGQQAFLKLVRDVIGHEDELGEAFRPVIVRGEAFLRVHPGSSIERELMKELARAHETWWSLSKASPDEEAPEDLARWKEGAEKARMRALELYRRLAKEHANEALKERIFRLEHDIDTGQRAHDLSGC